MRLAGDPDILQMGAALLRSNHNLAARLLEALPGRTSQIRCICGQPHDKGTMIQCEVSLPEFSPRCW